jgi:hypothetical protein
MGNLVGIDALGGAEDPREQTIEEFAGTVEPEKGPEYRYQHGDHKPFPHQAHLLLVPGLLLPAEGFCFFESSCTVLAARSLATYRLTTPFAGVKEHGLLRLLSQHIAQGEGSCGGALFLLSKIDFYRVGGEIRNLVVLRLRLLQRGEGHSSSPCYVAGHAIRKHTRRSRLLPSSFSYIALAVALSHGFCTHVLL